MKKFEITFNNEETFTAQFNDMKEAVHAFRLTLIENNMIGCKYDIRCGDEFVSVCRRFDPLFGRVATIASRI